MNTAIKTTGYISEGGKVPRINFYKTERQKFIKDDVMAFDKVVHNGSANNMVANPVKRADKHLQELQAAFENNKRVTVYVLGRNAGGFKVSYNGCKCFLPYGYAFAPIRNINFADFADKMLRTELECNVASIENDQVILTRKEILKADMMVLRHEELNTMYEGYEFTGTVTKVVDFGVFIKQEHLSGLLHISEIVGNYRADLSKPERDALRELVKCVFKKNRQVTVKVEKIVGREMRLCWDADATLNKQICSELEERQMALKPPEHMATPVLRMNDANHAVSIIESPKRTGRKNGLLRLFPYGFREMVRRSVVSLFM